MTVFLILSWGHSGKYAAEEGGVGGKRKGVGTETWQKEDRREEARAEETYSQEEGGAEKRPRNERSDTETEVEERWYHHSQDTRRDT